MAAETISYIRSIDAVPTELRLEQPFFITTPILFPENSKPTTQLESIRNHWDLAEKDFVKMYLAGGYGNPIRDFISKSPEGGSFELKEIGILLELESSDHLRRVRSTLGLGSIQTATDCTFWDFSEIELAQYMVGLVAKKRSNMYTRINERST